MLDRVRLRGSRGSYNLRIAELARDRKNRTISVTVLFLDDSIHTFQIDVCLLVIIYQCIFDNPLNGRQKTLTFFFFDFFFQKRAKGSELLDNVFQHLELSERDYFGLQFTLQPNDVVRWINPNKILRKQWPNRELPSQLYFRVKVKKPFKCLYSNNISNVAKCINF